MLNALGATLALFFLALGLSLIGLKSVLGVVLPLTAIIVFTVGVIWRVVYWAKSPVSFAIPTVGGQEKSLDFIKPNRLDAPSSTWGVIGRMALEVLTFRSLFRNTYAVRTSINDVPRVTYYSSKWLWLFALIFHYSFLVILVRHFRLFLEPVPSCILVVEFLDGILQIGANRFYMTNGLIVAGLSFLFLRRIVNPKTRYISLANDYFPLFLLLGIVFSGIYMRYFGKVSIAEVKVFTMGLVTLSPVSAGNIGSIFFIHLTFVSALLIYFPFSKLMHMGGIFFSPTRNMKVNTREYRHINPWNPPKKYHTYAEYEDDFREAMDEAGLPLDKPLDKTAG